MLEDFEPLIFGTASAVASITKNGVTFNKVALEKLNSTNYVTLLFNREKRQFAIRTCTQNDMSAMPFAAALKPKAPSVRWNNKELLRLFSSLMNWDLENCKGYKVIGEFLKGEKALLFDLNNAIPIS